MTHFLGALSIQPKIPVISVGTSNGTDLFGLVRPEYSGPALKVVQLWPVWSFRRCITLQTADRRLLACSRLRDGGGKSFSKRNAKNAATAPFPKSCASYFRFARFNMFPLYYLRAWHRLQTAHCMRQHDCELNETKNIVIKVASSSTLPCSEK